VLTLRIGLSAWLLLVVVSAISGLTFDAISRNNSLFGLGVAFLLALIVFPPVALCWGLFSAYWQNRGLARVDETADLLSVGSRKSISVELPVEQTLRIVQSALKSVFTASRLRSNDLGVAARISDLRKSLSLFSGLYEDSIALTALPEGEGRCVLRISVDPVHSWFYGLLAVDGGRCAQRMKIIEAAVQDRIRAQTAVIDERRRWEAFRARQSEAELAQLRAQIEPHFIFNTLAHVKAGLGPQSETARQILDALIDFLRSNTQSLNRAQSSLFEELGMVECYLKIVRLRLGERLAYEIHCPPSLSSRRVPSACILVLAENAVKHGIERTVTGGKIAIRCIEAGEDMSIEVQNNGPRFDVTGGCQGGLSNLQERLKLMYGASCALEIENPDAGGVRVIIRIPSAAETV
jgi:two-component sensor histidine kinase